MRQTIAVHVAGGEGGVVMGLQCHRHMQVAVVAVEVEPVEGLQVAQQAQELAQVQVLELVRQMERLATLWLAATAVVQAWMEAAALPTQAASDEEEKEGLAVAVVVALQAQVTPPGTEC